MKKISNILSQFNFTNTDASRVILPLILGTIFIPFSGIISSAMKGKAQLDKVANGEIILTINEANVLSVNQWSDIMRLDANNNGKFDDEDISFRCIYQKLPKDIKSIVYIDGIDKVRFYNRCLAYQSKDGEYIIIKHPSLTGADNLGNEFENYMSSKKIFNDVKMQNEIKSHTK